MRNRYLLLADLPLIAIAAFGAFALRFNWFFYRERHEFFAFVLAALLVKPIVFHLFSMYGRYWRYASVQDLIAVLLGASVASVAMAVLVAVGLMSQVVAEFSRPVLLIDWLLTFISVGGLRMSVRVVGDAQQRARKGVGQSRVRQVLVIGAGEAGMLVVREMQKNPQLGLEVAGFLDDSPLKWGKWINGVRVLGPLKALAGVARTHQIDEVIVAMPTAAGAVVRGVTEDCRRAGVPSRAVPGVFELLDGQVSVSRLRNVDIADLLRRSQILGGAETRAYVRGHTVLITGAGGSIGYELCRQSAHAGASRVVLVGHGENSIFEAMARLVGSFPGVTFVPVIADIRDGTRIQQVFRQHRPETVFHAAAHKHVPLMEGNPTEAITNNVLGTQVVVGAAIEGGTERFVLISTDKAVSPTSLMGVSKRLAEMIVRDAARQSGKALVVVRFGNVLGSRGSVVPLFKEQIERGGPVTVTHPDMKRFFMTIPEAVHLVMEAGGMGKGGELFVLNMGEQVRIVDLAEDLIKLSGFAVEDIPIVYTGMRPGEKLEEALWEAAAAAEPTSNPEVLKVTEPATSRTTDYAALITALETAAEQGNRFEMEVLLAQVIPTFVPTLAKEPSPLSR
jgi:FlaA1/EpsC-like NDP-sugar epimerase